MRNKNILKLLFVIGCVLSVLLDVIPGRFPHIDEVFYKSAGRHWAATGNFAAPEIVGRIDVVPGLDQVYFAYPPLYSFIFGIYTKLFGFSPRHCILFDALIHVLLAALVVAIIRREFEVSEKYAYPLGALVLMLGPRGRPDELAMCFALAGMLALTFDFGPARGPVLSGTLFGLCGATSLGACVFMAPMALFMAHRRGALTVRTAIRWLIAGALAGLACVAPILIHHPDAYRQLLAHAQLQSPQLNNAIGGRSPWKDFLLSYFYGTLFAARTGRPMLAVVTGTLIVIALCFRNTPRPFASASGKKLIVAAAGLSTLWLIMPGKYAYLWFFGPWLIGLTAEMLVLNYALLRNGTRALVISILAIFTLTAIEPYLKAKVILLTLPRNQSFDENMSRVRLLIPAGARVVTSEYWWALADRCDVLDPIFSHPASIHVDFLIKSGNGSKHPGVASPFSPYYEGLEQHNDFVVIEDDLNRSPLMVGPLRLTNSAYGFGPLVLGSKSKMARNAGINPKPSAFRFGILPKPGSGPTPAE